LSIRCELCGAEILGEAEKVMVDGAILLVCKKCASHGKPVPFRAEKAEERKIAPVKQRKRKVIERKEEEYELVDDYNLLIRSQREKMGLKQEELAKIIGEKTSLIQRIESGDYKPSIDIARKIEKALNIKLLKIVEEEEEEGVAVRKPTKITLGEIVTLKKKKKLKS